MSVNKTNSITLLISTKEPKVLNKWWRHFVILCLKLFWIWVLQNIL